jgi:hypothetical protein
VSGGRPLALADPAVLDRLLGALHEGKTYHDAAAVAGVGQSTLFRTLTSADEADEREAAGLPLSPAEQHRRRVRDLVRETRAAAVERQQGERVQRRRERLLARSRAPLLRWERMQRTHGLTRSDWMAMYHAQDGGCAVCSEGDERELVVDHDHETGRVRALLCQRCNRTLGAVAENPALLVELANYLFVHRLAAEQVA